MVKNLQEFETLNKNGCSLITLQEDAKLKRLALKSWFDDNDSISFAELCLIWNLPLFDFLLSSVYGWTKNSQIKFTILPNGDARIELPAMQTLVKIGE